MRLYDVTKGMPVDKDVNRYEAWAKDAAGPKVGDTRRNGLRQLKRRCRSYGKTVRRAWGLETHRRKDFKKKGMIDYSKYS